MSAFASAAARSVRSSALSLRAALRSSSVLASVTSSSPSRTSLSVMTLWMFSGGKS